MKRILARSIIAILLILLAFLFIFYLSLTKPKISKDKQPKTQGYSFIRGIYGPNVNDKFVRPHDLAVDSSGNIYVADSGNARVVKFDNDGDFIDIFGKKLKGPAIGDTKEFLKNPLGVSVAPDNGDIYISDRDLHKVVVLDSTGAFKKKWMVMMPVKPHATKSKLYLSTYGPFYVYDREGKQIYKWGRRGRNENQFDFPNGVTTDKNEKNIFIADSNNNQLKVGSDDGEIVTIEGTRRKSLSDQKVKYQLLTGLTFDDEGLLYSVDAFAFVIRAFSFKNNKLRVVDGFGKMGSNDGMFYYPGGIAYLGNRRFAIADEGNNRVQIIEIPLSSKLSKAAETAPITNKVEAPSISIWTRIVNFFKTLIGL